MSARMELIASTFTNVRRLHLSWEDQDRFRQKRCRLSEIHNVASKVLTRRFVATRYMNLT